ncbi:MAG: ELM1/GtrOC1 family putative glycosyltransferase [Hyphomicrobiales bacterium]
MTASDPPHVWLLIDDRPGHRTQVEGLARVMGWPADSRELSFNILNHLPNPLLGAGLWSLGRGSAAALVAPWPELVIGMGRRVLPVARWIKAQSGGRTRIVLLGRKAGGAARVADLYVSCIHFGALPSPRLFELAVPPTKVDRQSLGAARQARPDPLSGLPRPRIVLLVGGPTAQHGCPATFAARMAREVMAAAAALGGSLAIVTSRRTPQDAVAAMAAAAPQAHLHVWEAKRADNPYLSYLAAADGLVITGESESMLAEGAATGLPITIYPLLARPDGYKARIVKALRARARGNDAMAGFCRNLFERGWLAPPRDLALMHRAMEDAGLARLYDGSVNMEKPRPNRDLERLRARIGQLIEGHP